MGTGQTGKSQQHAGGNAGASRVALVTGAARGLGRAVAEVLADRGHRVFATMRAPDGRNAEAARVVAREASARGGSIEVLALDVTDDDSVASAFDAVEERAGGIDVVVSNAAITAIGLLESFAPDQLQTILDVNVVGAQRVARAALPRLRASSDGLLIFVSSGLGRFVAPPYGLYASSKFALEALAESYRYELAPSGVDVTILEPGEFRTSMLERSLRPVDPERAEAYDDALAALPERVRTAARGQPETPPEADRVGRAVAELVDAVPGTRPLRRLVGEDARSLAPLNAASERFQRRLLRASGLEACLAGRRPGEDGG